MKKSEVAYLKYWALKFWEVSNDDPNYYLVATASNLILTKGRTEYNTVLILLYNYVWRTFTVSKLYMLNEHLTNSISILQEERK